MTGFGFWRPPTLAVGFDTNPLPALDLWTLGYSELTRRHGASATYRPVTAGRWLLSESQVTPPRNGYNPKYPTPESIHKNAWPSTESAAAVAVITITSMKFCKL